MCLAAHPAAIWSVTVLLACLNSTSVEGCGWSLVDNLQVCWSRVVLVLVALSSPRDLRTCLSAKHAGSKFAAIFVVAADCIRYKAICKSLVLWSWFGPQKRVSGKRGRQEKTMMLDHDVIVVARRACCSPLHPRGRILALT